MFLRIQAGAGDRIYMPVGRKTNLIVGATKVLEFSGKQTLGFVNGDLRVRGIII